MIQRQFWVRAEVVHENTQPLHLLGQNVKVPIKCKLTFIVDYFCNVKILSANPGISKLHRTLTSITSLSIKANEEFQNKVCVVKSAFLIRRGSNFRLLRRAQLHTVFYRSSSSPIFMLLYILTFR